MNKEKVFKGQKCDNHVDKYNGNINEIITKKTNDYGW